MNDATPTPTEPPPPFLLDELIDKVRPRGPMETLEDAVIQLSVMLPAGAEPRVDVSISEDPDASTGTAAGTGAFEAKLSIAAPLLGTHAFPGTIEARKPDQEPATGAEGQYGELKPHQPRHLGLRPVPRPVPPHLRVPTRAAPGVVPELPPGMHLATTVFAPDDRYTFYDTNYPWSTIGRVETPGGVASGAMVGPRHVVTVSHTIQWNADGSAGWVRFTPMYYDGSTPFGQAWATTTYWEGVKVVGPTIEDGEAQHDYVCCVLNTRIGELTGWLGTKTWSSSWSGGAYWHHVGYPADLAGAQRPSYQGGIALNGTAEDHVRLGHQGDVWPGQSGGPFFGFWDDGVYAVSDQSAQNSSENSASGGGHMVNVVQAALRDFP
jgi:V8-like Glu-specific endopeptidase